MEATLEEKQAARHSNGAQSPSTATTHNNMNPHGSPGLDSLSEDASVALYPETDGPCASNGVSADPHPSTPERVPGGFNTSSTAMISPALHPFTPPLSFTPIGRGNEGPESQRVDTVRLRYLEKLSHYHLVTTGFVPNIGPLLAGDGDDDGDRGSGGLRSARSVRVRVPSAAAVTGTEIESCDDTERPFLAAGSVKSSIFNLTSATLGAGALSLPFAMSNAGIFMGVLCLILVGCLSMTSTMFVVSAVEYSELKTYEELAAKLHGHRFALLTELNIILFCFGTAVGYLISVGDVFDLVMPDPSIHGGPIVQFLFCRTSVMIIATFFVLLPLCLLERLEELRFTSFLGVAAIAFLGAVVVKRVPLPSLHSISVDLFPKDVVSLTRAMVLLTFAFSCQPNVPAIYCELEHQNIRRMEKVSIRAAVLCLTIYAVMGIGGFITWGSTTRPNIMSNYEEDVHTSWVFALAFVGMGVAITFAYPMNIFPCRFAIEMLIIVKWPHLTGRTTQTVIATTTVALTMVCAIFVPSISLVFAFVGATAGCFVTFLFPSYTYLKLLPGPLTQPRKIRACVVLVFGVVVTVLGTTVALLDIVNARH